MAIPDLDASVRLNIRVPTMESSAEIRDGMRSELRCVRAERDRAQEACEQMGRRITKLENGLLAVTAIIETQSEPDIDAMHDACRDALAK